MRAAACVVAVFVVLVPIAGRLYAWLAEPLARRLPHGGHLIATEVASPFLIPLKLAAYVALFVCVPVLVYQAWAFVRPGLYQHEKRLARPLLVAAIALFYGGAAFARYLILPAAFRFFTAVTPPGVAMMTDITHYLDFVLAVLVAFGLCFEIPVLQVVAVAVGVVDLARLRRWRRYVVVATAAIAAAVTPPDLTSMLLLWVPMLLLYELGLLAVRLLVKPRVASAPAHYVG